MSGSQDWVTNVRSSRTKSSVAPGGPKFGGEAPCNAQKIFVDLHFNERSQHIFQLRKAETRRSVTEPTDANSRVRLESSTKEHKQRFSEAESSRIFRHIFLPPYFLHAIKLIHRHEVVSRLNLKVEWFLLVCFVLVATTNRSERRDKFSDRGF